MTDKQLIEFDWGHIPSSGTLKHFHLTMMDREFRTMSIFFTFAYKLLTDVIKME